MKTSCKHFGFLSDRREALLYTLDNENGIIIKISNYGGTIISLEVPDKNKTSADVVLGMPDWEGWIENPYYFNCIVGRTCNRIGGASFTLDGIEYKVSANQGKYSLHGGLNLPTYVQMGKKDFQEILKLQQFIRFIKKMKSV